MRSVGEGIRGSGGCVIGAAYRRRGSDLPPSIRRPVCFLQSTLTRWVTSCLLFSFQPLSRLFPPPPWAAPSCPLAVGCISNTVSLMLDPRKGREGRTARDGTQARGRAFQRARGQCERVRARSEEGDGRGCLGQVRGGAEGARAERNARESRSHTTSAFGVFSDSSEPPWCRLELQRGRGCQQDGAASRQAAAAIICCTPRLLMAWCNST